MVRPDRGRRKPTTAYAHLVQEQGQLALQYWFYYPFNDWNNKHESDWEMIQLIFDAATAEEALGQAPALVGYSQHEGAESAAWDDAKLEKRDGHPVVYPGAGSHANQFVQSLYLGHGAQTGFGCDDTRGPTGYEQTQVVVVPSQAAGADDPFAWLGYLRACGARRCRGRTAGRPGPLSKSQWTAPITWVDEEWRPDGVQVPAASSVAPTATGFFCSAVAQGSKVYIRFLSNPVAVLGVLAAIVLFAVWLSRRTIWSPALPTPIRRRRDGGQLYRAGFRLYRSRAKLFLAIGLMAIPLGALATIAQNLLFDVTGLTALTDVADESGRRRVRGRAVRRVHDAGIGDRSSMRRAPGRSSASTTVGSPMRSTRTAASSPGCSRSPGRRCGSRSWRRCCASPSSGSRSPSST